MNSAPKNDGKKPRGRQPKSNFLKLREKLGITAEEAARTLGTSAETVAEFDINGAPVMAERLLNTWHRRDISEFGWNGFYFSRGILCHKQKRWSADYLRREQSIVTELQRLQEENKYLKTWSGLSTTFVEKSVNSISRRLGLPRIQIRLIKK